MTLESLSGESPVQGSPGPDSPVQGKEPRAGSALAKRPPGTSLAQPRHFPEESPRQPGQEAPRQESRVMFLSTGLSPISRGLTARGLPVGLPAAFRPAPSKGRPAA